jgi:hypothetical protein
VSLKIVVGYAKSGISLVFYFSAEREAIVAGYKKYFMSYFLVMYKIDASRF